MLSLEQFRSIEPGDVVEMGELFGKLTPEPVKWTARRVHRSQGIILFDARYFGVMLGSWWCTEVDGQLNWERVS